MYNPVSTYRFQFRKEFTLADLDALLPYLHALGVTTVYASPVFSSTPESPHGYDGIDLTRIEPEIGTLKQLQSIGRTLKKLGMGWLQDIVPNHMAYHPTNEWLMDVLEHGPLSRYVDFFDTSFATPFFEGRVMAPFLTDSLDDTLDAGELTVVYENGRLGLRVNEMTFPVCPESYASVLPKVHKTEDNDWLSLKKTLGELSALTNPEARSLAWTAFREQLASVAESPSGRQYVQQQLAELNADKKRLRQLADVQHYRFCAEPETRQHMNYRRFFAINGLIGLNVDNEAVFDQSHSLIQQLISDGTFQGVRIDHIDGLFNPTQYLRWLRNLAGTDTYVVVEKILQETEHLPIGWPVQGTTGYDFLAQVNNLLTDRRADRAFHDFYARLIGTDTPIPEQVRSRKRYFLARFMGGELENLHRYFRLLNLADEPDVRALTPGSLAQAIGELLVDYPTYRSYGNQMPLPGPDARTLRVLLHSIAVRNPALAPAAAVIDKALLTKPPVADSDYNRRALLFYQRLMQFTGPLMAKGVEDTLFYTNAAFIGHNEVGDSPERFGLSTDDFHLCMEERQQQWPLSQNTTATHDTKRGEDVRARLNILTELPDEWLREVAEWQQLNAEHRPHSVPDAGDEYFIYQNLLGAYPMPSMDMPGQDADNFGERFATYLKKALEEAKRHADGHEVDETYLEGTLTFARKLLDRRRRFWHRFASFQARIADAGIVNSLVQTTLKYTCPGVPDLYRGTEGWDLNLVDPDNRRPVDYKTRTRWLTDLTNRRQAGESAAVIWQDLWQHRFDGRIKLWLTHRLLHERRQTPDLFLHGQYIPLVVVGKYHENILAFARQHDKTWYVIVTILFAVSLCKQQATDIGQLDWADTRIKLPRHVPTSWRNVLDETAGKATHDVLIQSVLRVMPVALLRVE